MTNQSGKVTPIDPPERVDDHSGKVEIISPVVVSITKYDADQALVEPREDQKHVAVDQDGNQCIGWGEPEAAGYHDGDGAVHFDKEREGHEKTCNQEFRCQVRRLSEGIGKPAIVCTSRGVHSVFQERPTLLTIVHEAQWDKMAHLRYTAMMLSFRIKQEVAGTPCRPW